MEMKFLADAHLGRLAKWLRLFGYDTVFNVRWADERYVQIAREENRIFLTRDKKIKFVPGIQIIYIQSGNVMLQLKQLLDALKMEIDLSKMMVRCSLCNELLKQIDKEEIKGKVPDRVFKAYQEFFSCPSCKQIYWQGSHLKRMVEQLKAAKLL